MTTQDWIEDVLDKKLRLVPRQQGVDAWDEIEGIEEAARIIALEIDEKDRKIIMLEAGTDTRNKRISQLEGQLADYENERIRNWKDY